MEHWTIVERIGKGGAIMGADNQSEAVPRSRRSRTHFRTLGLIVAIVFSLYMGSYFALQRRDFHSDINADLMPRVVYRGESAFKQEFFRPAHAIDTVLRPWRWGPQDPLDEDIIKEEFQASKQRRPVVDP